MRTGTTNQSPNEQLLNAALAGDLQRVKKAIAQGADPHVWNDYALCLAAWNGHLGTVKYLIEELHADPHTDGDMATRWAARNGYEDVVHYLATQGKAR